MPRPVLFVLAGVNGAGKSSIGGQLLAQAGLAWFNPDTFARELRAATGCAADDADAAAWTESLRRLDQALSQGENHAFETTLGGNTMAGRLQAATQSHDVIVWFCGLSSPELHIARVQLRAAAGGHAVPEALIRQRCRSALENLIALMPRLAQLQIYDNSATAGLGQAVPDPQLLAEMQAGQLVWPTELASLQATPDWAKPLLEAALSNQG